MDKASWGVVCTCAEPTPLIVAFVAHHLEMGAHRVYLFLDQPDPELHEVLADVRGCEIIDCDEAYWQGAVNGPQPGATEKRQIINATNAYLRAEVDWLAHVDADEFLQSDTELARYLGAVPEGVDFIAVPNVERVFESTMPQKRLFDGIMRCPLPRGWIDQDLIFADEVTPYLRRGLPAHSSGKSIMRTGVGLVPGIHSPRPSRDMERRANAIAAASVNVFHYDGVTGLHWVMKLRRLYFNQKDRIGKKSSFGTPRGEQLNYVIEKEGEFDALFDLHQTLKTLHSDDIERLDMLGLICRGQIDPLGAVDRLGLSNRIDMSVSGFDVRLGRWQEDLPDQRKRWYRLSRRSAKSVEKADPGNAEPESLTQT
ncbi:glycosyltransferase family 2 protein [Tropicibacter sp. Alg240-R139]|uniref:glycosyltransferase family 2 protein n=1 Tax=Tropicibacter sp. Alg240-R139 TaxID=2305991 RepID=UPI0013DED15F|nr:glycosyltransferase family 2 protein [Tropicibacter sp. Alg240-R139]